MKPRVYQTIPQAPSKKTAILVGIQMPHNGSVPLETSLEELKGLVATAHYHPAATLTQKLGAIHPKTFLGSGKVGELLGAVRHHHPDAVVFDDDLSPAQNRNLEHILKCRVVDRSWLILEIFQEHARTREAKTQVELARLKYALPRLTRLWGHLSRQRGGIGLREVGETQIQLDRRLIRDQIHKLERKLKKIDREKMTQRKSRRGMYRVALFGYTNVGKSTLMNLLTGADTLVEDKLFATLDATTRRIRKNFPYPVLLADTVGLIDKLPHDLVASFKSTLDEIREADLILKVVDFSHPNFNRQMQTAADVLNQLGASAIDSILVFNKIDRITDPDLVRDAGYLHPDSVFISSLTGEGLDGLRRKIIQCYENRLAFYTLDLDYGNAKMIPAIRKLAIVVQEDYQPGKISLSLRLPPGGKQRLERLLQRNGCPVAP